LHFSFGVNTSFIRKRLEILGIEELFSAAFA
jgi:hypothetical protein